MSARSRFVRGRRMFVGICLVLLGVVAAPTSSGAAALCWLAPVSGTITDPYREPPCPWCAGNRGIDYRVAGSAPIRAAASGRVVFAGTVANVYYIVIQLANGWRHTYGQLISTSIELGDAVLAGGDLGQASGIFFFGLRIGDDYADPAPFIGDERHRARLIPLDGSPPRPAPPARLQCPQLRTAR